MDKVSKISPSSKVNNNSKPQDAYSQGERRDAQRDRALQQKMLYEQALQLEKQLEKAKSIVRDLEKIKKGMESKIVAAPVKPSEVTVPIKHDIKRVDINQMDRYAGQKRAIQAYTGSVRPKTRPATTQVNSYKQPVVEKPQTSIMKFEPKKTSLWDKMKKAIKNFFGVEEKTTAQPTYNTNTWSNSNKTTSNYTKTTSYSARSEQYRKSMATNINVTHNPKNTQTQYKNDPNKGKRLDRYV